MEATTWKRSAALPDLSTMSEMTTRMAHVIYIQIRWFSIYNLTALLLNLGKTLEGRVLFIYYYFFFFSKFIVQCVKKRPRNQSHKRIVATQSEIQLRRPIKCDGLGKNTCTGCLFYTHTHTHTQTLHTHTLDQLFMILSCLTSNQKKGIAAVEYIRVFMWFSYYYFFFVLFCFTVFKDVRWFSWIDRIKFDSIRWNGSFFFFGTLGRFFQLFPFQYLIENLSFELDIAEFIHPGKGFSLEFTRNVQKIN